MDPQTKELEAAIDDALRRARQTYPEVAVDRAAFAAHLRRHVEPKQGAEGIVGAPAADLYLALGCGLGDRAALELFERQHVAHVPDFVAHLRLEAHEMAELLQSLRERLLAPRTGGAKILDYSGRGPLGGWIRVAAVRLALTLQSSRSHVSADGDEVAAIAAAVPDPELRAARVQADRLFKEAFSAALAALDSKERTVLRMYYIDGLTIDQVGVAYAVHRGTAARWVNAGREHVALLTREYLRRNLRLSGADLESLIRFVDTELDLSLVRGLAGDVRSER